MHRGVEIGGLLDHRPCVFFLDEQRSPGAGLTFQQYLHSPQFDEEIGDVLADAIVKDRYNPTVLDAQQIGNRLLVFGAKFAIAGLDDPLQTEFPGNAAVAEGQPVRSMTDRA